MRYALFPMLLLSAACAGGGAPATPAPEAPPAPAPPPAPWSASAFAPHQVPSAYLAEWEKADNRGTCAPLVIGNLGKGEWAKPRAATFAGGWAVAYDLPDHRSAFGIAGTGVRASADTYDDWPHRRQWADGSTAGYGPEGGQGPKQLAYLRVTGQRCLYNVWSHLGRDHLELLLESLRFVRTDG